MIDECKFGPVSIVQCEILGNVCFLIDKAFYESSSKSRERQRTFKINSVPQGNSKIRWLFGPKSQILGKVSVNFLLIFSFHYEWKN